MNEFFKAGIVAMANDEARHAPLSIFLDNEDGIAACNEWFAGWDFANIAAKIPGWDEAEHNALYDATKGDRL